MDAQRKKLPKKQVEKNLTHILSDIKNRKHKKAPAGIIGRILTPIIAKMTVSDDYAKKFTVTDKCNKCGVCAKVCPAKNIFVSENVNFGKTCEGCLACTHLCPQNAIQLKGQRSEKRWLHPEVSLKEMIEANNRRNGGA
jgi:ferredoxin